jgi:hypothetical protein
MKKYPQQEQEKQLQKQNDNAQAVMSFCRTCKKEIYPAFRCGCGGGGPGGGSSGSSDGGAGSNDKYEAKSSLVTSANRDVSSEKPAVMQGKGKDWNEFTKPVLTPKEKMLKIIAELLEKNLLTIDEYKTLCTLTMKCDPALLSNLQRAAVKDFVNELKKQLDDFKDKNQLTDKNCIMTPVADNKDNIISFSINITNTNLYTQFIDQLRQNNLLPSQAVGQQEKLSNNEVRKPFHPTPLSTKLKPNGFKD